MRIVAGGLAVTFVALAAPMAGAQVLPPASQSIKSPPSESHAYGGNVSRTRAANEEWVFGPLYEEWTTELRGMSNEPLVVGDVVLVNYAQDESSDGSYVGALDAETGEKLWSQPVPGSYSAAPIAADDSTVVSANADGVVRAFRIADGVPRWTQTLPGVPRRVSAPPLVDGGTAYIWTGQATLGQGTLYALNLADGSTRWSADVAMDMHNTPALDNARVFIADGCGNAVAIYRSSGLPAWSTNIGGDQCFWGQTIARVLDGRVYAAMGRVYNAATGSVVGTLSPGTPEAVDGGIGFEDTETVLRAFSLGTGAIDWERTHGLTPSQHMEPLVVGGTIYSTTASRLLGSERSTGRPLLDLPLASGSYSASGTFLPGITAGARRLLVGHTSSVTSYRPVLRPGRDGVDLAVGALDLLAGAPLYLVAGVGPDRRSERPMVAIEATPLPTGAARRPAEKRTYEDGAAEYTLPLERNTRFRAVVGDASSEPIVVYAYPGYRLKVDAVSRKMAVARVRVSRVPARELDGREVVAYFGRTRDRRLVRVGAERLERAGPEAATAAIRFRIPRRVGRRDIVAVCVRNIARAGYGRVEGMNARCGTRAMSYEQAGIGAARARPRGRALPGSPRPPGPPTVTFR